MTKLSEKQLQEKIDFIHNYIEAENAAEGSKFDANVDSKNISTL
jgi:ribonucleoside-triphosphate reductase